MIAENLAHVQARVARATERAGRDPASVTIVGVSKTHPPETIREAHAAGLRQFGENRVQEAEAKLAELDLSDATWHLVGHLQTNKAKIAARLFRVIQSVDSLRVAEALSRQGVDLDVLLEVNYAGEESKFGFTPEEALAQAPAIAALPHIHVRGLMTVAPFVPDPETVRPVFRGMRDLGERVREALRTERDWQLSMGMTDDFEVAIEEGATIVRVGRAIFGDRRPTS